MINTPIPFRIISGSTLTKKNNPIGIVKRTPTRRGRSSRQFVSFTRLGTNEILARKLGITFIATASTGPKMKAKIGTTIIPPPKPEQPCTMKLRNAANAASPIRGSAATERISLISSILFFLTPNSPAHLTSNRGKQAQPNSLGARDGTRDNYKRIN